MDSIKLFINGNEVFTIKGKSVLEAALEAGIYIPHLCHHPDLTPAGVCGLCIVEIEGREGLIKSCTTPAEEGMVVSTVSDRIKEMLHLAMELIFSSHPMDCTTCPKYLQCELQTLAQYLGISDTRFKHRPKSFPLNQEIPLFIHDFTRCVLCGRCVRACHELRGVKILDYKHKNAQAFNQNINETYVGPQSGNTLAEADCRFCGACAEVCPTGAIRDKEEVLKSSSTREDTLLPCKSTCPAEIDVPRYVRHVKEGEYGAATAVIREKAPFPAVLGRVCNRLCENECRRMEVNEPISIRELKCYAVERDDGIWKDNSRMEERTGKKVAIIGSGPAGLTAAFYLCKKGHEVTVYEKLPYPGGMLRVGIPEYRLPREVLEEEIAEIKETGLEIKLNTPINSLDELWDKEFEAVVMAPGTHKGIKLPVPGSDNDNVLINTEFLKQINLGYEVNLGEKVVVLGGGNVAFDCARIARRKGAEEVSLVCLESWEDMPASKEEIEEGEEEGIDIYPARNFVKIVEDDGKVVGVECLKVNSFHFDQDGKPQIETVPGSEHVISADTVIFAVGQRPLIESDFGLEMEQGNLIKVNSEYMETSVNGVFAAGDAVTGTASVIRAVANGRKAASAVDKWLGGDGDISEALAPQKQKKGWIGRVENFAYMSRVEPVKAPAAERLKNFLEVKNCYQENDAHSEALRCLQCDLRLNISSPKSWGDYSFKKDYSG